MRVFMLLAVFLAGGCVFQDSPEIPAASQNNAPNNSLNNSLNNLLNNLTNNLTVNNTFNNTANNTSTVPACENFCNLFLGDCVTDSCALNITANASRIIERRKCRGTGVESCSARYQIDPDFSGFVDAFEGADCFEPEVEAVRCETFGYDVCDCPLPDLSQDDCMIDEDCQAGYLEPLCQRADASAVGQCVYFGCLLGQEAPAVVVNDTTGCGSQNPCVGLADETTFCLEGCVNADECRPGFGCRLELGGISTGFCDRLCTSDSQCSGDRDVCASDTGGPDYYCATRCNSNLACETGAFTGSNPEGSTYCVE